MTEKIKSPLQTWDTKPSKEQGVENAIFDYMDSYDCPQVFTDELRQTIAEDVNDIICKFKIK